MKHEINKNWIRSQKKAIYTVCQISKKFTFGDKNKYRYLKYSIQQVTTKALAGF